MESMFEYYVIKKVLVRTVNPVGLFWSGKIFSRRGEG